MAAKSAAQKMQEYRNRLKEKGGKKLSITLLPEHVKMIELIGKYEYPGLDFDIVVRVLLNGICNHTSKVIQQQLRLREEFNAPQDVIDRYVKFEKFKGIPATAEEFLEQIEG